MVGDQGTVERHRKRTRCSPDHFGRVPIRHLSEYCRTATDAGRRKEAVSHESLDAKQGCVDSSDDCPVPVWLRRDRADLQEEGLKILVERELDVEELAAHQLFQLLHCRDQPPETLGPDGMCCATVDIERAVGVFTAT